MPAKKKIDPVMPTRDELWERKSERREGENHKPFVWIGRDDKDAAEACLAVVKKNVSTALDTEFPTSGDRKDEVVIWSLSGASDQRYVLDGYWMKSKKSPFRDWIADPTTKLVYFSFPSDADVIEKNAKVECEESFHADVKVEGWLRNNNKRRHALKEEGWDYLRWKRADYAHMFGYFPFGKKKWMVCDPFVLMNGPLPEEMLAVMPHSEWVELFKSYAADDAEQTHTLHRINKQVLKRWGYWDNYLAIDREYTLTLRQGSKRGVPIDFAELNRLDREITADFVRHRTALRLIAENPVLKLDSQAKDLRELIFNTWEWPKYDDLTTEKGAPQLNKIAWGRYANDEGFSFARLMLPYNKLKTLKNTFINGIRWGVQYGPGAATHTLFSEYNQTGTKSGRVSSRKFKVKIPVLKTFKRRPSIIVEKEVKAGMNMLNFPNKFNDSFGVRRVVTAPPPDDKEPEGYVIVCGDFSGFELWMILYWCWKWKIKSKMLEHMMRGDDVHSMTAVAVCGLDCDWSEVKEKYPAERNNEGKRSNFGLGYGAGARVFCRILGWDTRSEKNLRKAQRMIDIWNDLWPEMPLYQKKCVQLGYRDGYVPTISGGRIWVEEGLNSSDDGIVRHYENLCKNGPAQGSAAIITKMAETYLERDRRMKELGYRRMFSVYDEIVGYCPRRNAKEVTERKNKLMKKPGYFFKMPYELAIEAHFADNWQESK